MKRWLVKRRGAARARGAMARAVLVAAALTLIGCTRPYRVGEYVWVEWEEGAYYPAYIVQRKGESRFRVHFDGYETRWDEDVTLDRIRGRIDGGPVAPPPPPKKVQRARELGGEKAAPQGSVSLPVSTYKEGDKLRVRWRGSVYKATVISVVKTDQVLVHYDGMESAWDEIISVDRIVTKL